MEKGFSKEILQSVAAVASRIKVRAFEAVGLKECRYCHKFTRDVSGGLCRNCDMTGAYMSGF